MHSTPPIGAPPCPRRLEPPERSRTRTFGGGRLTHASLAYPPRRTLPLRTSTAYARPTFGRRSRRHTGAHATRSVGTSATRHPGRLPRVQRRAGRAVRRAPTVRRSRRTPAGGSGAAPGALHGGRHHVRALTGGGTPSSRAVALVADPPRQGFSPRRPQRPGGGGGNGANGGKLPNARSSSRAQVGPATLR